MKRWSEGVINSDLDKVSATINEAFPQRNELTLVLIGNTAAYRDQVGKYGEVIELEIAAPGFGGMP